MSTMRGPAKLAVLGGAPVCTDRWPRWPQLSAAGRDRVLAVLEGERWAVSGPWTGRRPLDAELAERFATFVGVGHCVPVDHGSSALLAAFTALGIGPGDEVVVPGLTWVACASAVLRVGAVPVLADIDPVTLCVDPAAVRASLTRRTAAMLAVHLYCAMADMDELRAIAGAAGIALVEDAAQAHGARWHAHCAGSLGDIGVFSFQQGKVMTSGEGGAAVTNDQALSARIERLRGDGRAYDRLAEPSIGRPDLDDGADIQGWNMHLTEPQAALALDALARFPDEHRRRTRAAAQLDAAFSGFDGAEPVRAHRANVERSYYHYAVQLDLEAFAGRAIEPICSALSAELGTWVHGTYPPLNVHPLYRPLAHPAARNPRIRKRLHELECPLPRSRRAAELTVLLHHPLLLAGDDQLARIPEAFEKVRRHADLIPSS